MSFNRVASQVGHRVSARQNLLVSRHVARGPSPFFVTRRVNSPVRNLSSYTKGRSADPSSSISSPKAFALGAVLVAGFASALYSIQEIHFDTSRAYNPDTAWSDTAVIREKSKTSAKTLHEGLATSVKPSSEKVITHGTEDRSYDILSPEQVTKHLKKNETSTLVNQSGVLRYDTTQVACNDPLEDDHDELIVTASSPVDGATSVKWAFWAIYDGHS